MCRGDAGGHRRISPRRDRTGAVPSRGRRGCAPVVPRRRNGSHRSRHSRRAGPRQLRQRQFRGLMGDRPGDTPALAAAAVAPRRRIVPGGGDLAPPGRRVTGQGVGAGRNHDPRLREQRTFGTVLRLQVHVQDQLGHRQAAGGMNTVAVDPRAAAAVHHRQAATAMPRIVLFCQAVQDGVRVEPQGRCDHAVSARRSARRRRRGCRYG